MPRAVTVFACPLVRAALAILCGLYPALPARAAMAPSGPDAAAVRTFTAIHLIGSLRDEVWETAPPVSNFLQREPHEGAPPSQRTEFRVVYDASTIYVKVRAFDTEPARIASYLTRRDG